MMKKMSGMIGMSMFLAVGMVRGMDEQSARSNALVSVQECQDSSLSAVCLAEIKKTYSRLVEQRAQLLRAEEAYRKPLMEAQSGTIESDDDLFDEAKSCYNDLSAHIEKIERKFATADLASLAVSELVSKQIVGQNNLQAAVVAFGSRNISDFEEIQDMFLPNVNFREVMLVQLKADALIKRMSSGNAADNKMATLRLKLEELDMSILAKQEELEALSAKTAADLDASIATTKEELQQLEAACAAHTSRPYVIGVGSAAVGVCIGALAYKLFSSKYRM